MIEEQEYVSVVGARVHNLKNISVDIPRNQLTVITGMSGSGKSSLAFDTIFAEGQRRYIETFSAYARSFLGNLERPDADQITGLSPVISIEQKTTNRNPRSTIGTTTEIYDFFRLLYARAGEAYSYLSGERMVKYTEEKIIQLIQNQYAEGTKVYLLAPLVRNRKGHYQDLFENLRRKGYLYARVDGQVVEIRQGLRLDRYKNHDVELVVDKMTIGQNEERRLRDSVRMSLKMGEGLMMILNHTSDELRFFSKDLMCPVTGLSYKDPAPHHFSFNSPQGACKRCKGLGYLSLIDRAKIIPDESLTIYKGGIAPLGKYKSNMLFAQLEVLVEQYGLKLRSTPLSDYPAELIDQIMNGSDDPLELPQAAIGGSTLTHFEGVIKQIESVQEYESAMAQRWANQFVTTQMCPECEGQRLNKEALHFRLAGSNIAEISKLDISTLYSWCNELPSHLDERQMTIAKEILKEITTRIKFLLDVGLSYLSLSRQTLSLSGGESQRIRLATQIGSQLVNVLYILDEPSIGLHQRDNIRLINSLKQLRDTGNSVIVVEHDKEMMLAADWVIDMGPKAGVNGGEVIFSGTPQQMLDQSTLTADFLTGARSIETPAQRRAGSGLFLKLKGAKGHNLRNVSVDIPLGVMICVTGVSGSGKSSLVNGTLRPILSAHFYRSIEVPLPYDSIDGIDLIDKVVSVDQSPLGKTPRSNPATYTGVFADIRNLFVGLPEAKVRGYLPGRFSFNVKGGRCEVCDGNGYKRIEMNFLPDVWVPCEECFGKRYNRETLEVRFKGKSIADVLNMTITEAVIFFESIPSIIQKIRVLDEVGLGYIRLGQPSSTLSGGESQRVKLATELAKKDTGHTLYILDEPTTGLHFEDIRVLMGVINRLVDKGNTMMIIEHNMDVIKCADYIIEMGPEGGSAGGELLCCGTPEAVCEKHETPTTIYLREELKRR